MKHKRLLITSGIVLMVLSTVCGVGLFVYGFGPMITGIASLSSNSSNGVEMPGSIQLRDGHPGGLLVTIQSAGALPASCTVTDPQGAPVGLQSGSSFGGPAQAADGRAIRVVGLFNTPIPGTYSIECDGSGDFQIVEFDSTRSVWGMASFLGFFVFFIGLVLTIVGVVSGRRDRNNPGQTFGAGGPPGAPWPTAGNDPQQWGAPPAPGGQSPTEWPPSQSPPAAPTTPVPPVGQQPHPNNDGGIPGRYPR